MKLLFDVTAAEFQIIRDVLATHLGDECHVWVFGSRAKNTARFNSDLDLAIECAEPLSKQALIALNEAFDEAKLAFSVDVVDLKQVEPYFKAIIDSHKVVFPLSQNVPQLRFPEFSGEWEEELLENLATVERGKFSARPRNDPRYFGGSTPFIQTGDIVSSDLFINKYTQTLNDEGLKVSKIFPKDTVFITIAANIGDTAISLFDVACTDSVVGIQIKKGKSNPIWLKYVLDTKQEELDSKATQNAQKNINLQILKPLVLLTPSLPEQTKIAAFLSAVDTKIDQLTQKKTLLETYKKGAMQQIFSQQIRFKADEGREYPEWEEKKLGELCQIKTGKLDANAMEESGQYRFYTCAKEYYQINEYAFDTEALIISGNGANVGYIHYFKGKFNAYQRTYVLDGFLDNIIFIKYFLDKYLHVRIFTEKKEGNTPYIVMSTLSDMQLFLPSLEEQTKIANFLSAIDRKIDLVSQQLEQAKAFKKGLLQQMFV